MFRRTTRPSPFWPAAALLALLAAPHTLPAQDATPTVRAEVTNRTGKPIEFALVGPDGKDYGPTRTVKPSEEYRTSNRTLPGGSAKGYKWVVRNPDTGRVLKEVPADRAEQSITVGGARPAATFTPADSGSAQTSQKKGQGAPQSRADAAGSRQSAQTPEARGQGAATGQDTVATAKEILGFVNEERKQGGLAALVEDRALTIAAQKYARFMAQHHNSLVNGPEKLSDSAARAQTLGHKLDGKEPFQRAKAEDFPHMDVAEVAHAGPYVNAEQAVRAPDGVGWMSSKGQHRKLILTSKYTLAGVGVAYTDSGVPYYVMKLASARK
jgi:uncharacterized protein YkwD